uniref:Uncharacterized protein n=1 Tax=Glossina palpalis gambiensis TaxID=67801 RepID=A0A1B0ANV8_9MUSC
MASGIKQCCRNKFQEKISVWCTKINGKRLEGQDLQERTPHDRRVINIYGPHKRVLAYRLTTIVYALGEFLRVLPKSANVIANSLWSFVDIDYPKNDSWLLN